jgi:hypothetical protein
MEERRKIPKGDIIFLAGLVIFWIIWTFVSYYLVYGPP